MGIVRRSIGRVAVVFTATAVVVGAGTMPAVAAPPHRISIADVSVAEGNSGTTMAAFTITYAGPNTASTVGWATSNQTATAGTDYTASSGTASLPSGGCKCVTVNVPVVGDVVDESDETFQVTLSNPSAGTIQDGQAVGTIQDDDGAPTISVADAASGENAGPLVFAVTLSNASGSGVTVDYATTNGSATAGDDYVTASGTLTFVAGDVSEPVNVTLIDDLFAEGDEDLTLTLMSPSGATIADGAAVGSVVDNDAPPTLSIDDISVPEGDDGTTLGSFTVSLSKPHASTVTVDYGSVDGVAVDGDDYEGVSGTLSFAPGDTTETVDLDVIGDVFAEDEETFEVDLTDASGVAIGDAVGTATILDDDPDPALSVDDVVVDEGATASLTIALDVPAGRSIHVDYSTSDGTAVDGSDFSGVSDTLTFAPGEVEQTVAIDTLDDATYEADEAFSLELSAAVNASIADGSGGAAVSDNDPAPTFIVDDVIVDEAGGTATFNVVKTGDTVLDASVDVATVDGSATAGEDYDAVSETLVFGAADASVQVDVALTDDAIFEGTETFDIVLSNSVNATIGDGTGAGTISDDEVAPTVSIDDVTVTEGDAGDVSADFTISLVGGTATDAAVDYEVVAVSTTAGTDVDSVSGTATVPVGDTTATVSVLVHGDVTFEAEETFTVVLTDPVNATVGDGEGEGVISNDDAMPTVSIDDVDVAEGDAGTTSVVFTVTRSGATELPVSFDWATADGTAIAGADYVSGSGTRSIAPAVQSRTVAIDVTGDTTNEADEWFGVSVSGVSNATIADADGVATISDDDPAVATLTVNARKSAKRVQVRGILEPATSSSKVVVLMQKKVGSKWKKVARKPVAVAKLSDRDGDGAMDAAYRAAFKRPSASRYRFVVTSAPTAETTGARSTRSIRL